MEKCLWKLNIYLFVYHERFGNRIRNSYRFFNTRKGSLLLHRFLISTRVQNIKTKSSLHFRGNFGNQISLFQYIVSTLGKTLYSHLTSILSIKINKVYMVDNTLIYKQINSQYTVDIMSRLPVMC